MGFAVFLKQEYLGFDLDKKQRSDVFMNSGIVHLIQLVFIYAIWKHAATNEKFQLTPPVSLTVTCARFLASMFMHINVEKDVNQGIKFMKYAVNHRE